MTSNAKMTPPPAPEEKGGLSAVVGLVIVVALLGVGAYLLFVSPADPDTSPREQSVSQETTAENGTPSSDPSQSREDRRQRRERLRQRQTTDEVAENTQTEAEEAEQIDEQMEEELPAEVVEHTQRQDLDEANDRHTLELQIDPDRIRDPRIRQTLFEQTGQAIGEHRRRVLPTLMMDRNERRSRLERDDDSNE